VTENEAPQSLGRYKIVRELGHGAMGVVYEGVDPNIGRRVAIKTARRDVLQSSGRADEMMERFLREAKAAGALNHPNIVTIYDADEAAEGLAYIAMEFLDGQDLFKIFREKRRFDVKDAIEVCATVCTALAHAHENGVVHRDVKPSNIIVLSNGQIKVADFGIAHVSDSNLTQEGAMIGTPHYMSPEQFMGHKVDARSDLFSVGIILYELLTGEKPFAGEGLSAVMHNVIKVNPVAPRELNFAVNECLSRIVMKALSKDPSQRYQDGNAMAAALRECLKADADPSITGVGVVTPQPPAPATIVSSVNLTETLAGPGAIPAQSETLPTGQTVTGRTMGNGPLKTEGDTPRPLVSTEAPRRKFLKLALPLVAIAVIAGSAPFLMNSVPNGGSSSPNYYKDVSLRVYLLPQNFDPLKYDTSTVEECEKLAARDIITPANCEAVLTSTASPKDAPISIKVQVNKGVGLATLRKGWEGFTAKAVVSGYEEGKATSPDASAPGMELKTPLLVTMLHQ